MNDISYNHIDIWFMIDKLLVSYLSIISFNDVKLLNFSISNNDNKNIIMTLYWLSMLFSILIKFIIMIENRNKIAIAPTYTISNIEAIKLTFNKKSIIIAIM